MLHIDEWLSRIFVMIPKSLGYGYLQSSDFIFGAVNEQNKPGMPSGIFSFILGYKVN